VPNLRWLGLKISDAVMTSDITGTDALLPLTARDRRKIVAMLRNNPILGDEGPEPEWRAELQRMLVLNVKAEIEMMYDRDGGLEFWIDRKMFRQE
jgi:meiotic recombination protein SPO11